MTIYGSGLARIFMGQVGIGFIILILARLVVVPNIQAKPAHWSSPYEKYMCSLCRMFWAWWACFQAIKRSHAPVLSVSLLG